MTLPTAQEHPAPLFVYPRQSFLGRVVPKSKIYAYGGPGSRLKDLFVQQVEQIVWQHKLAPETVNLPARPGVDEIQVFAIQLKSGALHEDVLRCIDSAVHYPILFELQRGEDHSSQTKVIAAYKRPGLAATAKLVTSGYFATNWLPTQTPRCTMPFAVDMAMLYTALLSQVIPVPARAQESLHDWVARAESAAAKRHEIERVQARLAMEKHFNRKVEVNATLRKLQAELTAIEL